MLLHGKVTTYKNTRQLVGDADRGQTFLHDQPAVRVGITTRVLDHLRHLSGIQLGLV